MRQIAPAVKERPLSRNWTEARARKATLDRLQKAANVFAEIACIWDDEDMSAVNAAECLVEDVKRVASELQEFWAERDGDAA